MPGEPPPARPPQEPAREHRHHCDQRPKQQAHDPERQRQRQAKPVRVEPEQHLRQKLAHRVKEQHAHNQGRQQRPRPFVPPAMQPRHANAHGPDVRQRIADEDRPQKVLRAFQVAVQCRRAPVSLAHPVPDAQPVQREDARFHARHEKTHADGHQERDKPKRIHFRFTTSTSSSFTRRSSTSWAVRRRPRYTTDSPTAGTASSSDTSKPPIVSTVVTAPSSGCSRRKSPTRTSPLTRQRSAASFSITNPPSESTSAGIRPSTSHRMSSTVTRPAVPPNSSSTIAIPRCCRSRLLRSCNRFMLSGTNDGNSMASSKLAFGSSRKICVFKTPTIVSGVSSYTGSRRCVYFRAASTISSTLRSSGMAAICERGRITSRTVFRSRLMI